MSKVKWFTGAAVLTCTGVLGWYSFAGTAGAAAGTASGRSEKSLTDASSANFDTSMAVAKRRSAIVPKRAVVKPASVLSGKREVTIVRAQAFESGVSLDNGQLTEVDDDSGRQLFVPTPLGANKYLIKAYGKPNGHPASDEPACWQVYNPQTTEPLTVEGAVCDAGNPDQQFTITARAKKTYAISNDSAFLQYSPTAGLILEELGDAPLLSTFRFVDNGPARTPAGG